MKRRMTPKRKLKKRNQLRRRKSNKKTRRKRSQLPMKPKCRLKLRKELNLFSKSRRSSLKSQRKWSL